MSPSGWKSCLLAPALAAAAWLGTALAEAKAQGVVPGGWSPEFTYQTFGGAGAGFYGGGGAYLGYGGGFSPYGVGGFGPTLPAPRPAFPGSFYTPSSQAVNAVDPLIGAIRRSTRSKGGR